MNLDTPLVDPSNGRFPPANGAAGHHRPNPSARPAPFPIDCLPSAVGAYVSAAAKAIGCDPSMVALPLLASVARAVGNRRVIQLKEGWTEPAVIWGAIVGLSGTHKSPALRATTQFLQRRQSAMVVGYRARLYDFRQAKAKYDREMARWKKDNDAGPAPVPPEPPVCTRLLTTDATTEAIFALLDKQFDGLLEVRDELASWLDGIGEYKTRKGSDLGHWLSMWTAEPITVDRKDGDRPTLHVERAAVSLVGGIQPSVLRKAFGREHLQDGLCARLLLVMPEHRTVRWSEATVPAGIEAAMEGIIDALLALEPVLRSDGRPEPLAIPLTPEAKCLWVDYYNRHRQEGEALDEDLRAAWIKLEAYTARFALIFQMCAHAVGEASGVEIDEVSMAAAINLSDWFGEEARRVYRTFGNLGDDGEQRALVELIHRQGGRITARGLQRSSRRFTTAGQAEGALDELVAAGLGDWEVVRTGTKQRRDFVLTTTASTDSPSSRETDESVSVDSVSDLGTSIIEEELS